MTKFLRIGARGINLESIQYYELSGTLGAGLGRGAPAAATAQAISLVLHFAGGNKVAITDPEEARAVLAKLEHVA